MKYQRLMPLLYWLLFVTVGVAADPVDVERSEPPYVPPEYAARLESKIEKLREDMLVPGVLVHIRSGKFGHWSATFGSSDLAGKEAIDRYDLFRIGSSTKPWTGTVILQLVDEKKLKLDDPIGAFIDGIPNGERITIEHLLAMRSGLVNYTDLLVLNEQLDEDRLRVWTPRELVDLAVEQKENILFEPGEKFHYSNTNTILLGMVIEKLTDQKLEEVFEERIFAPLRMKESYLPSLEESELRERHIRGYQYRRHVDLIDTKELSPEDQKAAREGRLLPEEFTTVNPSWGWAAGSGVSNARELTRFTRVLVKGGLLSPELQKRRLESLRPTDSDSFPDYIDYGLGILRMWGFYGHGGELAGYTNFAGYDPETKTAIVVFTNLTAAPDGRTPALTIAKEIIDTLYGDE